jgi:signal transduction histidine kinase
MKNKLKLQTILLIINLAILLFPIMSIHFLRLYENELIRQTESELISQAAFLAAIYKLKMLEKIDKDLLPYYGIQLGKPIPKEEYYKPIPAKLDLAKDEIQEPVEASKWIKTQPGELAVAAGEDVYPVLQEAQRTTLAHIKILDINGVVVLGGKEEHLSYALVPEVQSAMNGQNMSVLRRRDNNAPEAIDSISRGRGLDVYVALPVVADEKVLGVVWVHRTPKNLLNALKSKKDDLLAAGGIAIFLVLISAFFASFTITRPVKRLIEQMDKFAQGDKQADFAVKEPITYEIAQLVSRFQSMAQTVRERAEYIKNFALHISHEFKTPLTSIKGTIELLKDHGQEMLEEEKEHFFDMIDKDTDRLRRLVNRLLELARAEVFEPGSEKTELKPVLNDLVERYRELNLIVKVNELPKDLSLPMNREVLERILTNLFDNSRQHGAEAVEVKVNQENEKLNIVIADDGEGISEADAEQIFRPFFTTNREKGGTGLGMGIIKSLLQAHGGDISLLPSAQGACFQLCFGY